MYKYLILIFLLVCLVSLLRRKDSPWIAALMAAALFLLVALRGPTVGPDTSNYLSFFRYGIYGEDIRDFEPFFQAWNHGLYALGLSDRAFLVVCAIVSIGFVLSVIWKAASHKILAVTLFLVCFEWSFYLTGLRQCLSMGFFTLGVFCLVDFFELKSFQDFSVPKRIRTVLSVLLLTCSVLMHTTTIIAVFTLILVFFFRPDYRFFFVLIPITFLLAVFGSLSFADELMEYVFEFVDSFITSADRYESYLEGGDESVMDGGRTLYLLLKDLLPMNAMALVCLFYTRRRKYSLYEYLYFWMVMEANLFSLFPFMFRIRMSFYPMACIAIATMVLPYIQEKRFSVPLLLLLIYLLTGGYITAVNLSMMPDYRYVLLG